MSELLAEEKNENAIDELVYNPPYAVKNNCLYEIVTVKEQVVPMILCLSLLQK